RIFSPEDGRTHGLQGMINIMLKECDREIPIQSLESEVKKLREGHFQAAARLITVAENNKESLANFFEKMKVDTGNAPVLGITGTGGAGKSSLTDELIRRFINEFPDKKVAILSVDPTKQKTGG